MKIYQARACSYRALSYVFVLVSACVVATSSCFASLPDFVRRPGHRVDIGIAALTLAKEVYPEVDISACSTQIDGLADEVRHLARGTKDPDLRVRCLNTVLFRLEKFSASRDSSFPRKQERYYLNCVLDTKQGNCFSMPLLYIAVAQRLGWPVFLVHVPDHSFARYVDPAFKEQNIETTSGGGYVPDAKYARDFLVSERGRRSGAYLRSLTYRELLADLVAINAITFAQRGDLMRAVRYLQRATRLNPRLVDAWANLENAYHTMAKRSSGSDKSTFLSKAATCARKLETLGFVDPKDVPPFSSEGRPL